MKSKETIGDIIFSYWSYYFLKDISKDTFDKISNIISVHQFNFENLGLISDELDILINYN